MQVSMQFLMRLYHRDAAIISIIDGLSRPSSASHFENNTTAKGSLLPIDRLAQFPADFSRADEAPEMHEAACTSPALPVFHRSILEFSLRFVCTCCTLFTRLLFPAANQWNIHNHYFPTAIDLSRDKI